MLLYYIAMSFLNSPKPAPNQPFDIVITVPGSKDGTPGDSTIRIGNGVPIPIGNINSPTQENVKQAIESYTTQLNTINQNPTVVSLNGVKSALASLKPLCAAYNGDTTKLGGITAANDAVITAANDASTRGADMGDITSLTTALTSAIGAASTVKKSRLIASPTTKAINDFAVRIDELVKNINTQIAKAQTAAAAENKVEPEVDEEAARKAAEGVPPEADAAKMLEEKKAAAAVARAAAEAARAEADAAKTNADAFAIGDSEKSGAETLATDADVKAKRLEEEATMLDGEVAALVGASGTSSGGRPKNTRKRRQKRSKRKTAHYRRRY
jgi:hypothetical protein